MHDTQQILHFISSWYTHQIVIHKAEIWYHVSDTWHDTVLYDTWRFIFIFSGFFNLFSSYVSEDGIRAVSEKNAHAWYQIEFQIPGIIRSVSYLKPYVSHLKAFYDTCVCCLPVSASESYRISIWIRQDHGCIVCSDTQHSELLKCMCLLVSAIWITEVCARIVWSQMPRYMTFPWV